jgi:hypothetical protein
MFAVFGRWQQKPRPRPVAWRRARLGVEALEPRYCLSTSAYLILSAQVAPGHVAQLSGSLSENNPVNATVTFSGAVSGTTTTDSYGNFSYSTTNAVLGTVTAAAVDQLGQRYSTQASLQVAAPVISLTLTYGPRHTATLSGKVNDIDPGGRTVTITGVASGSVTTNSDGTYSVTTTVSALGSIQASTVDLWGQNSNVAAVSYTDKAPQITNFTATEGQMRMWTFSGTVEAQYAPGLVVTFGGLASLQNQTATVGADGSFSLTIQLQPGETGYATAQVTDWWGLQSQIMEAWVSQT